MARKDGWSAKKWYTVVAPEMFGNSVVGETPADHPKKLIGRTIEMTLGELTNDYSKQHAKLIFKINDVDGNTARTKLVGHRVTRDYLRSLVKRRTSKIDAVVDVETNDGYGLRVKLSCFTVKRAKKSHIRDIRATMEKIVKNRAKELSFNQYIQEIVLGKLASDIYRHAKTIYPLRRVEMNKTEVRKEPA
ncbi:MAG: 30S ribosomal protein S3ae [Candidatus Syntropharchaeia archaeon]